MPPIGKLGYGASLSVGEDPAAVAVTVLLGGITSLPPPPFSRDSVEVTNMSSPDATREYIPSLKEPGEIALDLNWVPGNATDLVLLEMLGEDDARLFAITYAQVTPNRICTFRAFITAFEPGVPVDDKMTATVTFKVTGAPVWTDAA